ASGGSLTMAFIVFCSSRRRHTRFSRDWSSDVCSSDLDAAVRKMAGIYPYDDFETENEEVTLRSGVEEVNKSLEDEISDRLQHAGIKVLEARISHLAYASEIASAMLQRQQATAIVAAR